MAFAQPKIEIVRCPHCGADAEVWTDEAEGPCPNCSRTVCRTATQSCIDWCKYARDCLGDDGLKKYQETKSRLRKESLFKAAEQHSTDEGQRRLARARVEFAEQMLRRDPAADPNVVLAAAVLATEGAASPAAEPSSAASSILSELGYPEGFIKEVAGILSHLADPGDFNSVNFRVVRDADRLARGSAGAVP